jgi:hypothetical protein
VECAGGTYTEIITFDRDKEMSKGEQLDIIRDALGEAKAAYFKELAAEVSPLSLQ